MLHAHTQLLHMDLEGTSRAKHLKYLHIVIDRHIDSAAHPSILPSICVVQVAEVVPYLLRRATENGAVMEHAKMDMVLIGRELRRRFTPAFAV